MTLKTVKNGVMKDAKVHISIKTAVKDDQNLRLKAVISATLDGGLEVQIVYNNV